VPKSSPVSEVPVQAAVRMSSAGYSMTLQVPTEALHRECPITPDWAPTLNTVCNVEEAVDWKGTDWKTFGVILIVDPDCYKHSV